MNKTRGMLTLEQLKGMVAQGEVETVFAAFTDHYGRLMGKRFDAEMFVEEIEMADRHVLFKQCLKEIAESMGMSVTFMAKFAADQAGSSCHIHFSLWREGKNAFAGRSDVFKHFLGGWIAHV